MDIRRRIERLELLATTSARRRIVRFPTNGMTAAEIEEMLARRKERGPMSAKEWAARFCDG